MHDFNTKTDDELTLDDFPVIENELDLFKQELDVLFSTSKMDVLGDQSLGQNIEDLLWKTSFDSSRIQSEISDAVRSTCFMNEMFEWDIKVSLIRGTARDIAVIDVTIKDNAEVGTTVMQYVFR